MTPCSQDAWPAVAVLAEPQRRAVYDAVVRSEGTTRDEVARTTGISRSLAAFHLDKLVAAGLLDASSGRSGAGRLGRPAKRYRRSGAQVDLTVPARQYGLAAQVLAAALAGPGGESGPVAAQRCAHQRGEELGRAGCPAQAARRSRAALARVTSALDALGYQPRQEGRRLLLDNCPFHDLLSVDRDLTCRMNLGLLEGLLVGLGLQQRVEARLEPGHAACCVCLDAGRPMPTRAP